MSPERIQGAPAPTTVGEIRRRVVARDKCLRCAKPHADAVHWSAPKSKPVGWHIYQCACPGPTDRRRKRDHLNDCPIRTPDLTEPNA